MKKLILFLILVASCFWEVQAQINFKKINNQKLSTLTLWAVLITMMLSSITVLNAQVTFDRSLGGFGGDNPDGGRDLIQLNDCSYLVLGIVGRGPTGFTNSVLQKVDENGNHLWTYEYDVNSTNEFYAYSMVQTVNGILIAGTDDLISATRKMIVQKVDENGVCIWSKSYHSAGGGYNLENTIVATQDGNFVIAGTTYSNGAYLTKIDANGDLIWSKTYGTSSIALDVIEMTGGNLAMTGKRTSGGQFGTYLLIIDAAGTPICEKLYTYSGNELGGGAIIQTNDGGLAIAGHRANGERNATLLKTDNCGNLSWSREYMQTTTDASLYGYDLIQNADDTYRMVGRGAGVTLLSTSSTGVLSGTKDYAKAGGNSYQIIKTNDNAYAIVASRFGDDLPFAGGQTETRSLLIPNFDDIRLIKTDTNGDINGCEINAGYEDAAFTPTSLTLTNTPNTLSFSPQTIATTCTTPVLNENIACTSGQSICNTCTIDLGADQIICEGDTSWLSVGAGWTSVKWYFDGILQAGSYPNPYPLTDEGEYCISVEDASGCVATNCISIQVISSDTDTPTFMTNIMVADPNTNYDEYGYSGLENQAGKYVVLGTTIDLPPLGSTNDYAFVELDYIGNVLATPKMNGYLNPFNNEGRDETAVSMIEVINPTTSAADGYVVTGWSQAIAGGTRDMMISRLDSDGCNIWTQYIPGTVSGVSEQEYGRMVIQSSDGNFWIVGNRYYSIQQSSVLVVNVAYAGSILSAKEYDIYNQNAVGMALTELPDFFPGISGTPPFIGITGRVGSDILFMGIDGNNNAINTAWYDCDNDDSASGVGYSIQQDNNGSVVITGSTRKLVGINLYEEPFILKLNGFPVFYPGGGTVSRVAWFKKYNLTDGGARGTSIVINADNEYILAGTKDMPAINTIGSEGGRAFLMKMDDSGDPIWANHYLATNKVGSKATQVSLTKDGGHFITGSIRSLTFSPGSPIGYTYDILALKTDSKGDVKTCDCSSPFNLSCVSVNPSVGYDAFIFGLAVAYEGTWTTHSCLDLDLAQDFCDQNDNDTIPSIDTMSCLYFDGDDDRIQASGTGLNAIGTGDFTFEAWIQGEETEQFGNPAIFSNRVSSTGGVLFFLASWSPGGPNRMLAVQLASTNHFITFNGTYNASVLDDECHHVAITRQGGLLSFYIDGLLIGTKTLSATPSVTSGDLVIAGDNVSNNPFEGHISDVRIWNVARSATEIQDSSTGLLAGSEPNLVANWQLNEASGQAVFDNSPNGYDGLLGTNAAVEPTDPTWGEDCCSTCDPTELVIDGDFNDPTGASFTSGLPQNCICDQGSWCIDTDPRNKCTVSGWNSFAAPVGYSPNFLIVDGFSGTGTVWSQPVTVNMGAIYEFSFWYYPDLSDGGLPNLDIQLDGTTFGSTTGTSGVWTQYTFSTIAPVTGSVSLDIVQTTSPSFSDFAIDHISFHEDCDASWNPCDPIINLGTTTVLTGTVHAQNQVISASTVPSGVNVSLKAGQIIELQNGFSVEPGAELSGEIEDCGGN